ncbi:unnamed protein product [Nesidiocoris tenuis]|uniref:Fatty acid desaturase domain-containing protein n=1 Tax=Nesidiocoris tenuis TaxID=355587 RepID=A0A6H5G061_9HEMI|nr:unnamed protein product [Nesidiocoris tenuis]
MAPNLTGSGSGLFLADAEIVTTKHVGQTPKITKPIQQHTQSAHPQPQGRTYKWEIVWRNVFGFIYLHLGAAYGLYLAFVTPIKLQTTLFTYFCGFMGGMGITAGAHRLWAHKTYKANTALRVILMVCNCLAFQNHVYEWVRDHRVHHKFTDTDADPHNSRRGFFFSHMGWLLMKKHSDVKTKGKLVDMSDLEEDKVLMFQKK